MASLSVRLQSDINNEDTTTIKNANNLSLDEIKMFKAANKDILPELVKYIDNTKVKKVFIKPHEDQTAWITSKKVKTDDEKLETTIRLNLNKLNDENFNDLVSEIRSLKYESKMHLDILATQLFKKVIGEKNFVKLYVKLTKSLLDFSIADDQKILSFKTLILRKCQDTFDIAISLDPFSSNLFKYKEEIISYMVYIGELSNINIISSKIIYSCYNLIANKITKILEDPSLIVNNNILAVELLCALFEVIKNNFNLHQNIEYQAMLTKISTFVTQFSSQLPKKNKFMLQDILESCNIVV